jgi:hypothetical protein
MPRASQLTPVLELLLVRDEIDFWMQLTLGPIVQAEMEPWLVAEA